MPQNAALLQYARCPCSESVDAHIAPQSKNYDVRVTIENCECFLK